MIILQDSLFSQIWLSLSTSPHWQSWRWLALSLSQTSMWGIDRYGFVPLADMAPTGRSTEYDYYSLPPKCKTMLTLRGRLPSRPAGPEEVINHKILIIKGTKVDLAVRQVGRQEVRVLGVTGGFCGGQRPPVSDCSWITTSVFYSHIYSCTYACCNSPAYDCNIQ